MKAISVLAVGLLGIASVSSAAELTLPHTVQVLAVNGKGVDSDTLKNLPVGDNQIVVEYSERLRDGSSHRTYASKPLIFTIDVKKADDQLELSHKRFRVYDDAKSAFEYNNVEWALTTNGNKQPVSLKVLPAKGGFMPYADIEQVVKEYNQDQGIVLTSAGAMSVTETAVTVDDSGKVQVSGDAVTQLKLWYSKASKAERKEFRRWMIDQE